MRHCVLQNALIAGNFLLLRATGQTQISEHTSLLKEFYSNYDGVCKKAVKKFSGYSVGDKCCNADGYIDLKNKLIPLLNDMKRKFESINSISPIYWSEDLSIIDKQLFELLETSIINKDVIQYIMNENVKMHLNRCTLISSLILYFNGSNDANSFSTLLHNSITNNFITLGLDGAMSDDTTDKVNQVFMFLKGASGMLQKYIGTNNPKAVENMRMMAGIPKKQEPNQATKSSLLLPSFIVPTQDGNSGIALDHEVLVKLEKTLDSMYLHVHAPIISELFCYCFILLTIEIEKNRGSLPLEVKDQYIKAISDLEILDSMAILFYDLPTMAKTGKPKFSKDICRNIFMSMHRKTVLETLHKTIIKSYSEDPSVQLGEVLRTAFGTIQQELINSGKPLEVYVNKNSKLVTIDILANMCWAMLLSTFVIDENVNLDNVMREIELFGSRSTSPARLYMHEMPDILNILIGKKPTDKNTQNNIVFRSILLKVGSRHEKPLFSAEGTKNGLMNRISFIIKDKATINQYKTYVIVLNVFLFVIDALLLLFYWRALKANRVFASEESVH
ncbi:uncharacterized protein VICG_00038 [Vittaforma corneae ATCC 50505]|uniref:Uncharacterized protein n=1 Tax=Vittaforma corneae (strain ATCC 50505) TaxID=993615 RepID=L2GPA9_VITCO|nr:uncharacterized protein VICG_00038 [Vittaforma corneae ATCC 50505]ELA42723.1 hypothetical protein VICG_00038 [Vittaforma corneae ATCC 50505]